MMDNPETTFAIEPLPRLRRDVREAARVLSPDEARYLVNLYYMQQNKRKRSANQLRSMVGEPHSALAWVNEQDAMMEKSVRSMLQTYAQTPLLGQWALSIIGIGPVIAAGLLAHIDITKAPTAGHIWRFAGVEAGQVWLGAEGARKFLAERYEPNYRFAAEDAFDIAKSAGRQPESFMRMAARPDGRYTRMSLQATLAKLPWNATLKTLCWHLGQSFMKLQEHPNNMYGQLYLERKAYERFRNETGELVEQAIAKLENTKISENTMAYKWYAGCISVHAARKYRQEMAVTEPEDALAPPDGNNEGVSRKEPRLEVGAEGSGLPMLPPAHIDARARRWTVKLFLAHYHEVAYWLHYRVLPPAPYPFGMLQGPVGPSITFSSQDPIHQHYIPPPNTELIPGLEEALTGRPLP